MDLVEITYNDDVAEFGECLPGSFTITSRWFEPKTILNYYYYVLLKNKDITTEKIDDMTFTLGRNRVVELYDCYYENEPDVTTIGATGRQTTCDLIVSIGIANGKWKGKMCIRNENDDPLYTDFEIILRRAQAKLFISFDFFFSYSHIIYGYPYADFTISYDDKSEKASFSDLVDDVNEEKLLKVFIMEKLAKLPLEAMVKLHENTSERSLDTSQEDFDKVHVTVCTLHNRRLRVAFNNLAGKIIDLTNSLISDESFVLPVNRLYGFEYDSDDKKILHLYKGYIDSLNTLSMIKEKNAIVSKEDHLVIVRVPVELREFVLHYDEKLNQVDDATGVKFSKTQTYKTEENHFCIVLERLSEDKVLLRLRSIRINNFKPTTKGKTELIMDHLISYAIEEAIKTFLEKVFKNDELQELAINPDVEINYYWEDLWVHDSNYDSSEELEDMQSDDNTDEEEN